jgi:hypothetical protein
VTEFEGGLPRAGEIAPGAADQIGARPTHPLPEATESLVELAIESVLEQVPEVAEDPEQEGRAKYQPWADTAAPPAKNKRPLEELLDSYRARVAASPGAHAGHPAGKPPAVAFFDRFGQPRQPAQPGEKGESRRRSRGRRRHPGRGRRSRGGRGGAPPQP